MLQLDDLRLRLSRMTNRILFRMEERAHFPLNLPVYDPGAGLVAGTERISFLEFALRGLEAFHASLGRYEYPDQNPILRRQLPLSGAERLVQLPAIPRVDIDLKEALFGFYTEKFLPELCEPGDDPNSYGETAYLDADLLELLHERINVGRYVARAKAQAEPGVWSIAPNARQLEEALRDRPQEERIMASVRDGATDYGLKPEVAELVFRWVIEQTIRVEVAWLQAQLPGKAAN